MVINSYRKGLVALVLLLLIFSAKSGYGQVVGDFRSRVSGNWTTPSTWDSCSSITPVTWVVASTTPVSVTNVTIRGGHTVTAAPTGPYACRSLVVDLNGKLFSGQSATNVYISVWGTLLVCNGEIGNGAIFDGISFNFEARRTSINGSGTFNASRFRKNTTTNDTTDLNINTNVALRWDIGTNTMLWNNTPARSKFNVTIGAGRTLNCIGSATNLGNVSIDGLDGLGSAAAAGTITVNGTLNVAGKIYLRTNNVASTTNDSCSWIVNNGGILKVGSIFVGASATAGNFLRVFSGGKLEITGSPGIESSPAFRDTSILPTTGNTYFFYPGSFTEYSGAGNQFVPSIPAAPSSTYYGNLKLSGGGIKDLAQRSSALFLFKVYNNLEISDTTGTPVFKCNNWQVDVGGNWINYNQSGFDEGTAATAKVNFWQSGVSTITCPGGENFNILRFSKSPLPAQVQFNNNVTVADKVEWAAAGAYNLNGNDLILKNRASAAITNGGTATRYIISERTDNASRVVWNIGTPIGDSTYIIPFGKSATGYVPFRFVVPAGVNADTMKVATYATPSTNLPWPTTPNAVTNLYQLLNPFVDNSAAVVDRFWQINSTAATPPALDFRFTYLAAELPTLVSDATTIGAQNWNTSSNAWRLPVTGTGAAYTVDVTGTNFFGPWTLVGYSSPLPVELMSFTAVTSGKIVLLNWATASELNNQRFEVERSSDGRTFYRIGTVAGAGTTSMQQTYSLRDEQPLNGISYYRLIQVDFDGSRNVSKVVAVKFRKELQGTLYPQPASDLVFWDMEDKAFANDLIFSIYTPAGTLVQQQRMPSQNGGRYAISTTGLANSIYFLVIEGEGLRQQIPLLINR